MLVLAQLAATAADPAPSCGVADRPVATNLGEMPKAVQKDLANRIADRGTPFNVSDAVPPGQEHRPFMRLICGYVVPGGYVVEREQGGRGYNIGRIVFYKTADGYAEQK